MSFPLLKIEDSFGDHIPLQKIHCFTSCRVVRPSLQIEPFQATFKLLRTVNRSIFTSLKHFPGDHLVSATSHYKTIDMTKQQEV